MSNLFVRKKENKIINNTATEENMRTSYKTPKVRRKIIFIMIICVIIVFLMIFFYKKYKKNEYNKNGEDYTREGVRWVKNEINKIKKMQNEN